MLASRVAGSVAGYGVCVRSMMGVGGLWFLEVHCCLLSLLQWIGIEEDLSIQAFDLIFHWVLLSLLLFYNLSLEGAHHLQVRCGSLDEVCIGHVDGLLHKG